MGTSPGSLIAFQPQEDTLTYEPFYGLKEKPFGLDSDPRFLFHSPSHAATYENLLAGIRRREGMLVLTGEIGAGKTTLCRAVLRNLGRKTFSSFVPDPFATREDLLKTLLIDFGVMSIRDLTTGPLQQASRTELSYLLAGFLESIAALDAFVVVIIDEAQNMSLPLIEETRILFDAFGGKGRLQIVFVGQPELHAKLKLPEMRQVDQRICGYSRLAPLSLDSVAGYIQHRLQVAGRSREGVLFPAEVIDILHCRTGGVPRLVNRVCDRALHLAHERQAAGVDRETMEAALIDVGSTTLTPTWDSIMADAQPIDPSMASSVRTVAATTTPAATTVSRESRWASALAEPAWPVEEEGDFSQLVDEWVTQDLPPAARPVTPLRAVANETVDVPAPPPSAAPRAVVKREAPAKSSWRDKTGDLRPETYMQKVRRTWAKRAAVAVMCVAVAEALVIGADRMPDLLAGAIMSPPELPALPTPPMLVVSSLVPPASPPIEEPAAAPEVVPAVVIPGDYLVAVGLFASPERADRLEIELTQAGLPAVQRYSSAINACTRSCSDPLPTGSMRWKVCSNCGCSAATTTPT
ncbi:MAG: AAA family ATPase [Vicinamibacterales bacterium]